MRERTVAQITNRLFLALEFCALAITPGEGALQCSRMNQRDSTDSHLVMRAKDNCDPYPNCHTALQADCGPERKLTGEREQQIDGVSYKIGFCE